MRQVGWCQVNQLHEVSVMSQSLLYHAFGIKGVSYRSTDFFGNAVIFHTEADNRHHRCPQCGQRKCIFRGRANRWLRMPPIGRKQALLDVTIHRVQCKQCQHLWWPQLSFVHGTTRYTRSFALTVLDLLRNSTIQDVARYLHISWDVVKDIHKRRLAAKYRRIDISKVKYLGIDEFSIRKGHTYMTIFVDQQSGRVLHAVEGTEKQALEPFLKKLSRKAKKLKAVSMDMSRSFIAAFKEHLPGVPVVFDRYHIMAIMNRQIDILRREQQSKLATEGKHSLKGSRYLLLRNYHSLSDDHRVKLNTLLEANRPLATMHIMKEQLRLFWEQGNEQRAKSFLNQWLFDALMSGIRQLVSVAMTIIRNKKGIMAFYPHKITNGLLEGLNNKIKTMKRQAYGFRDTGYFKLRIYDLHESKYAFTG